eukprot:SAG31_NODE_99_length_25388_cov_12.710507_17_plen_450_part_00
MSCTILIRLICEISFTETAALVAVSTTVHCVACRTFEELKSQAPGAKEALANLHTAYGRLQALQNKAATAAAGNSAKEEWIVLAVSERTAPKFLTDMTEVAGAIEGAKVKGYCNRTVLVYYIKATANGHELKAIAFLKTVFERHQSCCDWYDRYRKIIAFLPDYAPGLLSDECIKLVHGKSRSRTERSRRKDRHKSNAAAAVGARSTRTQAIAESSTIMHTETVQHPAGDTTQVDPNLDAAQMQPPGGEQLGAAARSEAAEQNDNNQTSSEIEAQQHEADKVVEETVMMLKEQTASTSVDDDGLLRPAAPEQMNPEGDMDIVNSSPETSTASITPDTTSDASHAAQSVSAGGPSATSSLPEPKEQDGPRNDMLSTASIDCSAATESKDAKLLDHEPEGVKFTQATNQRAEIVTGSVDKRQNEDTEASELDQKRQKTNAQSVLVTEPVDS